MSDEFEPYLDMEGDCPDCDGTGEVCCSSCEGSGCSRCCDGQRTCMGCGGSGYLPPPESDEE
jgi:hypothetical protein